MKLIDKKIGKTELANIAKERFGNIVKAVAINIYVDKSHNERIEFDSMINIRPNQNNRSRDVLDPKIKGEIAITVNNLVE